ncbi:MAG: hypothetical protein Q8O42_15430 [Acidobacteriota bacterium]|nr:hypothetical protein [Acidobacteriota bacterium]
MTIGSIASTHDSPQDLAHVRRIATELYRFDRRSTEATLDELAAELQQTYLKAATAAAFLGEQERLRPALYDAADQLVPGGIGNLTRQQRAGVVKMFIRAFQVMRDNLCGLRHPDTAELMRVLATKDASVANASAPVTDAGVDLATIATTGVQ